MNGIDNLTELKLKILGPEPVVATFAPPAVRVRALGKLGPVTRLESGLSTLDRSCRGGVPTRRLVVVGGAPGAGKTTLVTNLLWRWAKAGTAVAMLAVDEDADGILMRIAQMEGIDASLIEEREPHAIERLAQAVETAPLLLVDGDEAQGTVEGVVDLLVAKTGGGGGVLIVDSIQTAKAKGTDTAGSPRERIDLVLKALKAARDKHGLLVMATCELARGSYRSRSTAEQINDLAAFKESGGIEYAAQTALVLRSVPDESSLVDVVVAKNRAYRKDPFRLRLDHASTWLTEVDQPGTPEGRTPRPNNLEKDAASIRMVLLLQPGIGGIRGIRTALRARKITLSNDRADAALEYMRIRGEIEDRGAGRHPRLWLRRPSEAS